MSARILEGLREPAQSIRLGGYIALATAKGAFSFQKHYLPLPRLPFCPPRRAGSRRPVTVYAARDCIRSGVVRKDVIGKHPCRGSDGSEAPQTPRAPTLRTPDHTDSGEPESVSGGARGRGGHRAELHEWHRTRGPQLLDTSSAQGGSRAACSGGRPVYEITTGLLVLSGRNSRDLIQQFDC